MTTFKTCLCLVLAIAAPVVSEAEPVVSSRAVAAELVKSNYTYQLGAGPRDEAHVDCTSFVIRVLERELKRKLTAPEQKAVAINYATGNLEKDVADGRKETQGIVYALSEVMKIGEVVTVFQVKPGDFIQYWQKKPNGKWSGHAGVIGSIVSTKPAVRITLIGAHETPKPNGYIGEADFDAAGLNISDRERRVYVVRLKPQ